MSYCNKSEQKSEHLMMQESPSQSIGEGNKALGMLKVNVNVVGVAQCFGVHEQTIYDLQNRLRQTCAVRDSLSLEDNTIA